MRRPEEFVVALRSLAALRPPIIGCFLLPPMAAPDHALVDELISCFQSNMDAWSLNEFVPCCVALATLRWPADRWFCLAARSAVIMVTSFTPEQSCALVFSLALYDMSFNLFSQPQTRASFVEAFEALMPSLLAAPSAGNTAVAQLLLTCAYVDPPPSALGPIMASVMPVIESAMLSPNAFRPVDLANVAYALATLGTTPRAFYKYVADMTVAATTGISASIAHWQTACTAAVAAAQGGNAAALGALSPPPTFTTGILCAASVSHALAEGGAQTAELGALFIDTVAPALVRLLLLAGDVADRVTPAPSAPAALAGGPAGGTAASDAALAQCPASRGAAAVVPIEAMVAMLCAAARTGAPAAAPLVRVITSRLAALAAGGGRRDAGLHPDGTAALPRMSIEAAGGPPGPTARPTAVLQPSRIFALAPAAAVRLLWALTRLRVATPALLDAAAAGVARAVLAVGGPGGAPPGGPAVSSSAQRDCGWGAVAAVSALAAASDAMSGCACSPLPPAALPDAVLDAAAAADWRPFAAGLPAGPHGAVGAAVSVAPIIVAGVAALPPSALATAVHAAAAADAAMRIWVCGRGPMVAVCDPLAAALSRVPVAADTAAPPHAAAAAGPHVAAAFCPPIIPNCPATIAYGALGARQQACVRLFAANVTVPLLAAALPVLLRCSAADLDDAARARVGAALAYVRHNDAPSMVALAEQLALDASGAAAAAAVGAVGAAVEAAEAAASQTVAGAYGAYIADGLTALGGLPPLARLSPAALRVDVAAEAVKIGIVFVPASACFAPPSALPAPPPESDVPLVASPVMQPGAPLLVSGHTVLKYVTLALARWRTLCVVCPLARADAPSPMPTRRFVESLHSAFVASL